MRPLHAAERALIEQLLAFPAERARGRRAPRPHRIAAYALELAQALHGLLPRLPRAGRRAGGGRVVARRAVDRERAHDRALPAAARRGRAAGDVGAARRRSVELRHVGVQARGVAPALSAAAGAAGPPAARAGASAEAAGRARPAGRARRRAAPGRRRGRSRGCCGSAEHRRAVLRDERALDLRFALALRDQARDECPLAVACGDWATFSGILQVTHITWRSIVGSDGLAAAAPRPARLAASASASARRQRSAARARSHELSRQRDRHAAGRLLRSHRGRSRRRRPQRSTMKLSGSWSVP